MKYFSVEDRLPPRGLWIRLRPGDSSWKLRDDLDVKAFVDQMGITHWTLDKEKVDRTPVNWFEYL